MATGVEVPGEHRHAGQALGGHMPPRPVEQEMQVVDVVTGG